MTGVNVALLGWNDAALAELRRLWGAGVPVVAIGAAIGCSKNAVVGKAHRIDLTPRPSPIIRDGVRQPPRDRRPIPAIPARTLPRLSAAAAQAAAQARQTVPAPRQAAVPRARACATPPLFTSATGARGCEWIMRPFRPGDDPVAIKCNRPRRDHRSSWCAEHAASVYRPGPSLAGDL